MIVQHDEQKRNTLWNAAISVSSVLIIIIAAFFFIKLFTDNPMEGKWSYEESNLIITVKSNGTAVIEWPDEFDGLDVAVNMKYSINKDAKIFTLHADEDEIKLVAKKSKGAVTTESLDSAIASLEGSYDYSIERNQLTLTEREYGERMVFEKK